MEFYISPQSGQFYMINVLENQWLSVTFNNAASVKYHVTDSRQYTPAPSPYANKRSTFNSTTLNKKEAAVGERIA